MKGVLLIIDGLGDLPVPALGGKTPLEAAATPVMDALAAAGRFGLIDPDIDGETPSTYSGAGALMGMDVRATGALGRGPVEAAGLGLDLRPTDVALRVNFATVRDESGRLVVLDRRAGRISEGAGELARALQDLDLGDGIRATLMPTHQHRAVVVLSGEGLNAAVGDTDPGDERLPAPVRACAAREPGAERTASAIDRFVRIAHERLDPHPVNQRRRCDGLPPANGVITRGAGAGVAITNSIRAAGLRAGVVTGCNTVAGLGRMAGFDVITDKRFTGDLATDLDAKIAAAIAALQDRDLVFVHIKAPDICAHDRAPQAKRDFLEKIDAALAPLAERNVAIGVAADHTTDSNSGLHTDDPVPAILYSPAARHDGPRVGFSERACKEQGFERRTSEGFLREFIEAAR